MTKLLFIGFLIFRIYMWVQKNKTDNPTINKAPQNRKSKGGLNDILGDFIKELENKNKPKPAPVYVNTDSHKAQSDEKQLDWQAVSKTKFKEKKQLIKRSNFSNISHHNENIELEKLEEKKLEVSSIDLTDFDLKKAVIYKEVLERKYFSI